MNVIHWCQGPTHLIIPTIVSTGHQNHSVDPGTDPPELITTTYSKSPFNLTPKLTWFSIKIDLYSNVRTFHLRRCRTVFSFCSSIDRRNMLSLSILGGLEPVILVKGVGVKRVYVLLPFLLPKNPTNISRLIDNTVLIHEKKVCNNSSVICDHHLHFNVSTTLLPTFLIRHISTNPLILPLRNTLLDFLNFKF